MHRTYTLAPGPVDPNTMTSSVSVGQGALVKALDEAVNRSEKKTVTPYTVRSDTGQHNATDCQEIHALTGLITKTKTKKTQFEGEMHELIFDNNPGEQMEDIRAEESDDVVEKTVEIYEGLDPSKDHRAVTQVTAPRHPDRAAGKAVTVCLTLVCGLLLAGIISTGLYFNNYKSWAEKRHQTLVELSHFCKDGCMSFRGSFYYISARQKSWVDSRHDCKGRGADLVIVNKKEEQEFINSLSRVFWIGLTDREEEGTWKWVDGSVLNSTGFWKTGQPSGWFGGLKEDCVNTFWYKTLSSWNDNHCNASQHWICEKSIDF